MSAAFMSAASMSTASMSTAAATGRMSTTTTAAATCWCGMRCAGMGSRGCMCCVGVRCICMCCIGVRLSGVVRVGMRLTCAVSSGATAACKAAVIGGISAAPTITSATTFDEAMSAQAVAIAPAGPWAHAEEDAVVEVPWAVKAVGRAGVRRVVVVAVLANGLNTNADADDDLRLCCRREGQAREQCCSSDECFESTHI